MANDSEAPRFPLLEEMLRIKRMPLKAGFTNGDLARLFGVSGRAICARVQSGQLTSRNLPGRAKFLPSDVEEFLRNSKRNPRRKDGEEPKQNSKEAPPILFLNGPASSVFGRLLTFRRETSDSG